MSTASRLVVVGALALAVGLTVALRRESAPAPTAATAPAAVALPRLVTNYLVAALLFVVGLDLLGAWPFHWSGLPRPETTRRGVVGAFLFGSAFGTALGPCTLAFLGPVAGLTMKTAAARPTFAMLLMLAYAGGHCGVLALAGASGPRLAGCSSWSERGTSVLRRVCGGLVLAGGLFLVYAAP